MQTVPVTWTHDCAFPGPVLGIDDAGTGAWAGPLILFGVILPRNAPALIRNLTRLGAADSKTLTFEQLERIALFLYDQPDIYIDYSLREHFSIDKHGMAACMTRCIQSLCTRAKQSSWAGPAPAARTILMDGGTQYPWTDHSIKKGDARSLTIACASVLATYSFTVTMKEVSRQYTRYGFDQHHGYGTKGHRALLEKLGPCEIHRKSVRVVSRVLRTRAPSCSSEEPSRTPSSSRARSSFLARVVANRAARVHGPGRGEDAS